MKNLTIQKVNTTYRFSDENRINFQNELNEILGSPYKDFETFAFSAFELVRRVIPKELFQMILDLKRNIYNEGHLVIENTPLDPYLIPTPLTPDWTDNKQSYISEAVILGIGQLLGEIYGYRGEKRGALIHNNYPTQTGAISISNEGSKKVLPMHNEDIHVFPYSPTFLLLSCIRQGERSDAYTYVLNVKDVIEEFNEEEIAILRSKLFYIEAPESFDADSPSSSLIPIISGPAETPQISIEFTDSRGISKDARHMLQKFKEVCQNSSKLKKIKLKSGDVLIMDNRKTIHGRSNFQASFDGTDRWCQRIFVKSGDLWDWREKFTKERILEF